MKDDANKIVQDLSELGNAIQDIGNECFLCSYQPPNGRAFVKTLNERSNLPPFEARKRASDAFETAEKEEPNHEDHCPIGRAMKLSASQIEPDDRYPWEDENGNEFAVIRGKLSRSNTPDACRACNCMLLTENRRIADGCPCNSPRGVNHGLVPKNTCTCAECDPNQTGSTRIRSATTTK